MKKVIIAMAVFMMAFGNAGFAQRKADLKTKANEVVLKHFGLRDESMIVPQVANLATMDGSRYRTTYTYDEYDYYLIEELTEVNEGGSWRNYSLSTHEYDFSGNVLETVVMESNGAGWQNAAKISYTYESGLLKEVIVQEWEDGSWENEEKQVYDYSDFVITVLYWDWNGNNWSSNELYTYNYENLSVELIIQYMQGGAWQNDERQVTTFDFDGNMEEILEQDWQGGTWVNDALTTYNVVGGVYADKTVQEWDGASWENDKRFTYEYDENGNAKHGESFDWNGSWTHDDGNIEMYFGYGGNKMEYYGYVVDVEFVDLTGVNENVHASFVVYPVPAKDMVHVEAEGFQKAEIYSLTGQKLMESTMDKMNVSSLSQGVYLLKVYDQSGNSETQRIVVK